MPALSIYSSLGLPDWLRGMQMAVSAQQACVLITLVKVQGSVPREAGARMLVSEDACIGTIGGGHLEWKAIQQARSLLTQHQAISSLELSPLAHNSINAVVEWRRFIMNPSL